jgi:hypothetical protein
MADSSPISATSPDLKSQDFELLRAEGMTLIQGIAANTWTDHNLHDPGITLWEAICYALTETGLRAGMDIKDLIASSAPYHEAEFFTAAQVLPSAPVKALDFQKLLISHPLINSAWVFPLVEKPSGKLSFLLEFANDELNSNQFVRTYTAQQYIVEIAFPHWDEVDVQPLQEDVILQLVTFNGLPGDEWNKIAGGESYFARASITYQPQIGGPQVMQVWIVANILTVMQDPVVEAPIILQDILTEIATLGDNSPADQTILKQLNRRVTSAFESMRIVRRFLSPYRNLCENLAEFNAVRLQEISINATLEVNSGVNIEELLAEIYYRIYRFISPVIRFGDLDDQLEQALTADAVFDGPITSSGFLADSILGSQKIRTILYASDILRIIYQLRNTDETDVRRRENVSSRKIIALRNLSMSNFLDNRPINKGARDCLQLVNSKNHIPRLSVAKSNLTIYRNGIEVAYDRDLVSELLKIKLSNDIQEVFQPTLDLAIPVGETYPVREFYPIQNDLPGIYGVGELGLPERADETRIAKARQLKGYMFLFEQMHAGSLAQLSAFNAFFSADPSIDQTLFQQPVYNIPDIAPLHKQFNPNDPTWWTNFKNNNANPYVSVLREKVETREQFLIRRNATLDHLLASLGEDMEDRTGLLLRLATEVPEAVAASFTDPVLDMVSYQNAQRQQALQELIRNKSAYYYDLPMLNRDKAQAIGHPLWKVSTFLKVAPIGGSYAWTITDQQGNALFQHDTPATSMVVAYEIAGQVMKLATREESYTIRIEGIVRRLEIRTDPLSSPLGISAITYATDPLAATGIQDTVETTIGLWVATTLTPLERRLYHMLGIDIQERRQLINQQGDYIEIFDNPDVDPLIEKRFRLWSESGLTGTILLEAATDYEAATDPAATLLAEEGTRLMIEYGIVPKNYLIENPAPATFRVALLNLDGSVLARSEVFFTEAAAKAAAQQTRRHLFRLFSTQGFYLLENHLLFPPTEINPALEITDVNDPYSFQITLVLPSGLARDFSDLTADPVQVQPHLYNNREFQTYAENQIRKHCPAQILPRIIWADRVIPGEAVNTTDPSFDAFEEAYLAWFNLYIIDEIEESVIGPARDALTEITTLLYQHYYAL